MQSNFNSSNIFGTMEASSRHEWFELLRVNHGTRSGSIIEGFRSIFDLLYDEAIRNSTHNIQFFHDRIRKFP